MKYDIRKSMSPSTSHLVTIYYYPSFSAALKILDNIATKNSIWSATASTLTKSHTETIPQNCHLRYNGEGMKHKGEQSKLWKNHYVSIGAAAVVGEKAHLGTKQS